MCTYIHSKMWKAANFTMLVLLEDDPINIEDPPPHQKNCYWVYYQMQTTKI